MFPYKLTVELGRTSRTVKEILNLAPGSVVELDKLAGEAVDILVNEKLIAKGEGCGDRRGILAFV